MLSRQNRIELLAKLGKYILDNGDNWQQTIDNAKAANAWFTKEHIEIAASHTAKEYLQKK